MSTSPTTPLEITPAIETAAADWVTRSDVGLTTGEQHELQTWLAEDPRHGEAYDGLKQAWSVFDRVEEGGVVSAVLAGLDQRAQKRRKRRLQVAAAAAAVFLLGVGLWPQRVTDTVREMERSSAGPLAFNDRIQRLPDGSIVELKDGAEIEVDYQPEARHVRMVKGEAFFRVAKDPSRPFYVEAHGIDVRAVGTAFSVNMRSMAVDIFVKEGAVDVGRSLETQTNLDANGNPQVVRVPAGKRFTALIRLIPAASSHHHPTEAVPVVNEPLATDESISEPQTVTDEEMEQRLAWRNTLQEFNGNTLDEAVALLNHQNLTQIVIKDPMVGRLRVSGYFRADNPEGLVRMMEGTFGLKAENLDPHTILLEKVR